MDDELSLLLEMGMACATEIGSPPAESKCGRRRRSEVRMVSHKANAVKLENTSIFGEFPVHMRKTALRDQMADVSNASRNALARTFAVRSRVSRPGKQERGGNITTRVQ